MFLSVIIPAYNEEKRLPETLKKVRDYLNRQNITSEVIVINDGSTDQTAEVVQDLIKDWDNFRLIDNKENRGKGAVVKRGMLEARGTWRLFMDADGSTDLSEIEKLWPYAKTSAIRHPTSEVNKAEDGSQKSEVVIGSRYLKADSIKIKQPLARRIVSRLGNWLIRILLGLNIKDTQCGFKLFSARAAQDIFPLQTIDRWGFDMEILAIAKHRGYKIKEVAVDWYDATGSQVKKSAAWKTLKELLVIKWNLLTGKYN